MTLYKNIGSTDTTITVLPANTSPAQPGTIQIESEVIHYQSCDQSNFFGCTRGYNSTSPATHAAGVTVTFLAVDTPSGEGTLSVTVPLTSTGEIATGQTVSIPKADATHDGYLAQGDFSTFNGKQANLGVTLDTDGTLAANSDTRVPSQKAVKTYADTKQTALGFTPVNKAGDTMSGVLNMGSHKIVSVTDPTAAQDAATKNYVDTHAGGSSPNSVTVTNNTVDFFTTGSATYVDTGFGVTITPTDNTKKIRVNVRIPHFPNATSGQIDFTLKRNGTDLSGGLFLFTQQAAHTDMIAVFEINDAPASALAQTYEVWVRCPSGSPTPFRMNDNGGVSEITATEIH